MNTLDLILFIATTALGAVKDHVGGDKTKIPLALTRIAAASNRAYQNEKGLPMDMSKIREYEPIPAPESESEADATEPADPATT